MKPEYVKLNTKQKLKAVALATHKEIPLDLLCIIFIAFVLAVITYINIPVLVEGYVFWDVVLHLIAAAAGGAIGFLIIALTYGFIRDSFGPLFSRIKANYEEETLKIKKKVLDNVIDDEILNK